MFLEFQSSFYATMNMRYNYLQFECVNCVKLLYGGKCMREWVIVSRIASNCDIHVYTKNYHFRFDIIVKVKNKINLLLKLNIAYMLLSL